MQRTTIALFAGASLLLMACGNTTEERAATGGVTGAALGAATGGLGAAALGGAAGAAGGAVLDEPINEAVEDLGDDDELLE